MSYDGGEVDPQFRRYASNKFWDDLYFGKRSAVYWVEFMPAAAILIRRTALLEVGGFDPLFFMYGEDDDLCRRLRAAGWKIGFVPDAVVQHWHGIVHARKSFRWLCTREYSEAVFHLKWSPRALGVAFLTLAKRWAVDAGFDIRRGIARALAFGRCVLKAPMIARHRKQLPYSFRPCHNERGNLVLSQSACNSH
jgi:GT2 family glycosyltransferase